MSEEKRILDMIAEGKISPEDGLELLNALKSDKVVNDNDIITSPSATNKTYNFLKIKVISDEDITRVNVNIPLKLVKALGGLATNVSKYLPEDAKSAMRNQGIDISEIDIEAILKAIEEGAVEGPFVDVEVDEHGVKTRVLIYVE
jgi:hypothetical protein